MAGWHRVIPVGAKNPFFRTITMARSSHKVALRQAMQIGILFSVNADGLSITSNRNNRFLGGGLLDGPIRLRGENSSYIRTNIGV